MFVDFMNGATCTDDRCASTNEMGEAPVLEYGANNSDIMLTILVRSIAANSKMNAGGAAAGYANR